MNISELAKFRGGVSVDTISELTSASGVTVDGVLLKDSAVSAASGVTTPTITESVSGSGVTVDGVVLKDSTVTASGVIGNAAPISLTNNAATTVYTITDAAGEAGKIEGRLQIAASGTGTSYTTWCGCSYSRQLNGTDYNIGGAFFDDSIPTGTVFSASGSAVQITLPNVANFSSASYRFTRYS